MYIIAIVYFGLAVLIFLTFVAEPQSVGIDMTDDHMQSEEKEENNPDDYFRVQPLEPNATINTGPRINERQPNI